MRAISRGTHADAKAPTVTIERVFADQTSTVTIDSDDEQWFARAAQDLLSPDAGLALHYLTGIPESTCYRAARGDNPPSVHLIRKLLHGAQGETWLNVLMDGCDASWWREHRAVRDEARQLREQLAGIRALLDR